MRPALYDAIRKRCDKQGQTHEEGDLPKRRSARSHRGRARDASAQEQERESENVSEHVATRRRGLRANESSISSRTLLGTWNDFMWPLIVLTDKDLYTLPVALAALSREHVQDDELMMAGSVVTIVPVLLVFLSLQRYYLQGLLAGSVKG